MLPSPRPPRVQGTDPTRLRPVSSSVRPPPLSRRSRSTATRGYVHEPVAELLEPIIPPPGAIVFPPEPLQLPVPPAGPRRKALRIEVTVEDDLRVGWVPVDPSALTGEHHRLRIGEAAGERDPYEGAEGGAEGPDEGLAPLRSTSSTCTRPHHLSRRRRNGRSPRCRCRGRRPRGGGRPERTHREVFRSGAAGERQSDEVFGPAGGSGSIRPCSPPSAVAGGPR